MMKPNHLFMSLVAIAIGACNNNPAPSTESATTTQSVAPLETTIPPDTITEEVIPTNDPIVKMAYVKNSEGKKKIKYTISEETIDSLNNIVPVYNVTKYNRIAVSYFSEMAESLHGRPYFVESQESLSKSIVEIVTTRINEGTDLVFLIDKTGSMNDDIETVKNSLQIMMDYLSRFSNVKVGIAFYGDENYHYKMWYNSVDLTRDIDKLRSFMEDYTTIGNPDDAESVNDGIVRTIETMHWTPGNRRLMLVIGDAPSQEPPLSRNSSAEVIKKCADMNVQFNLYPVIISAKATNIPNQKVNRDFVKLGPNPANESCTLSFANEGTYNYEINDINGRTVLNGANTGHAFTLDLSAIPTGSYLIQVYNNKLTDYFSTPLIVSH